MSTQKTAEMPFERPWEAIPARVAELLRPRVPAISDEVIAVIRERVPAYRRPLRGRFGLGIRRGVEEALAQFVDLIAEPGVDRAARDEVYRALGRGEFRERRSLDALLAAYRLGARVAWRRVAATAIDAGVDRRTLALLAEAVFAYIDELSALSVEGYAGEQSAAAGESQRRRLRLATVLLATSPADEDLARGAARDANWEPPATLAALVWSGGARRILSRLPAGTLTVQPGDDGIGVSLVPDPEGPLRRAELERASRDSLAVLGPTVPWLDAAASAERARAAHRLAADGTIRGERLLDASDHLAELIARGDESLIRDLALRRLAPLDPETPASRRRLTETLRSWLDHQGEVARVAAELHVHPQTVRYRLGRLRDRLGDALDDPQARFELALALRAPASEVPSESMASG